VIQSPPNLRALFPLSLCLSTLCLIAAGCGNPDSGPGGGAGGSTGGAGGSSGGSRASGGNSGSGGSGTGGATGTGGAGTGGSGTGGSAGGVGGTGGSGSGGSAGGSGGGSGGNAGGSGGSSGTGGATGGSGTGGSGTGGAGGSSDAASSETGSGGSGGTDTTNFSFFVISQRALTVLSGKPEGFGGDLRFGKPDGLSGADELCKRAAEMGKPGAGSKTWRALLSVASGPGGMPVHARDRIGPGPWYDRNGRLMAMNLEGLFAGDRPMGDAQLVNDMTNERGEPNHRVGLNGYNPSMVVDNHDTLTGSNAMGRLQTGATCNDWMSATGGRPMIGHSWPRSATSGRHWVSDHSAPGCAPGVDRTLGGAGGGGSCVGCSGGYGGFYCFAVR
jgi:hypothetical protein